MLALLMKNGYSAKHEDVVLSTGRMPGGLAIRAGFCEFGKHRMIRPLREKHGFEF